MINTSFVGNVGQDAVLRDGKSPYLTFSIAVKDKRENSTKWVDCIIFGAWGESLEPHINKGTSLFITGNMGLRIYKNKHGEEQTKLSVKVNHLDFIGSKRSSDQKQPAPKTQNVDQDIPF